MSILLWLPRVPWTPLLLFANQHAHAARKPADRARLICGHRAEGSLP